MRFHKPTKIVFIILLLLIAAGTIAAAKFYKLNPKQQTGPCPDNLTTGNIFCLTNIVNNQVISSPVHIEGQARGSWYFEAVFPVKVLDAYGKVLGSGQAHAKSDWMTNNFVPFFADITFSGSGTEMGRLVFQRDNPSGRPEGAAEFSVPIKFTINKTTMDISSPAFQNGQPVPKKYTCQGDNINPQLDFSNLPSGAKSLALVLHDPDAPRPGGFTHWVIYNMPPQTSGIPENSQPAGIQGNNGAGNAAYTGPCPPSGAHRYYFYLYALDADLDFKSPPNKDELEKAMQGHIVGQAELMGTYIKE